MSNNICQIQTDQELMQARMEGETKCQKYGRIDKGWNEKTVKKRASFNLKYKLTRKDFRQYQFKLVICHYCIHYKGEWPKL